MKINKNKGITLIALVITIIVLLILAGVSIATLTGENGIITQAMNAKERAEIEEDKERIKLAYISLVGKVDFEEITPVNLQKEIEDTGYENIVTQEKDENGKKGLLINLTKKDKYYFIESDEVREATKEEFSKEVTPVYAILYSDGDLRFNTTGNQNQEKLDNDCAVILKTEDISKTRFTLSSLTTWYNERSQIKTVTFEEKVVPQYTGFWFYECTNLEKINNIEKLFTDKVSAMEAMFLNCKNLKSIDLSGFNTSNATRMNSMFCQAESIKSLDLSNFDTSNVYAMDHMFDRMVSLEDLKLGSNFKTTGVKTMTYMFFGCSKLSSFDLSSFDTSTVQNMKRMFSDCDSIKTLDLSNFNTSNVKDMHNMFDYMDNVEYINISSFDTSNVENMEMMFLECKNLKTLDLSQASFDKVTLYEYMFRGVDTSIKVIVADDEAKAWVQDKLGNGIGTVIKVSELPAEP